MSEEQKRLSDEERELEEAEKEFNKQIDRESTIKKVDNTPLAKDILIALGFIRYDNLEKGIAYKLHVGPLQIGRTYSEKYPIGNMWVRCLKDCEFGKAGDFPKRDECKKIPLVALFYKIRNGELPIPEPTVTGKVVGKSEKAVQIQFEEFGQTETYWWGFKAVYTEDGEKYIPASFSKETETYTAKMQVPRNIILENYEAELKDAEITTTAADTGKHEEEVASGTVADKIPAPEPESREETIANIMKTYLKKGREMVEQIFPELEQPQLSELSQDIATSMFIEYFKEARKERW